MLAQNSHMPPRHGSPFQQSQQFSSGNDSSFQRPSSSSSFRGGPTSDPSRPPTSSARSTPAPGITSHSLSQVPDLMPSASDPWMLQSQQQTPRATHRFGHHRESSMSSIGSNGPASPYNHNTSNPHIAVADSQGDGFQDLNPPEGNYSYQLGKPMLPENLYYGNSAAGGSEFSLRGERGLAPAAELSAGSIRSHPGSSTNSPHTPPMHETEDERRRRYGGQLEEMYHPSFSGSPLPMSSVNSPAMSHVSRTGTPFRHDSPHYVSAGDDFSISQMRSRREHEHREMPRSAPQANMTPKDSVLEFDGSDEAANMPLFPPQESNNFGLDSVSSAGQPFQPLTATAPMQSAFNFSMPSNIHMPLSQQYPFVPRSRPHPVTPPFSRMGSADGSDVSDGSIQRPLRTAADGGTYTCTYHGCTRRFETPALLQKHKREGHRQANALNSIRSSPSMTSSMLNSQAGPHKCERINPSTGKPCNTIFSRPYDLTRHEDTIHNARKQKVRCNMCTEEKTFSRADALTRHYRVCHPDVEFPGKHRRRGAGI